jgi:hypothetical protein
MKHIDNPLHVGVTRTLAPPVFGEGGVAHAFQASLSRGDVAPLRDASALRARVGRPLTPLPVVLPYILGFKTTINLGVKFITPEYTDNVRYL